MNTWIILRTRGAYTLSLCQSLAWASIEAWSPAETIINRNGESRSRRKRRIPVMPSFVFARAEHKAELQAIKEALTSPHPEFWFMHRRSGGIAEIDDCELDPLRVVEQSAKPREEVRQWKNGERVRYPAAGFEGLVGVVEGRKGKLTLVCFAGLPAQAQIEPSRLLADNEQAKERAA